ncbi:MAG: glycoside hydrolase family 15 protein, partial [Candidatus Sulfotelmatobacter sp.]
AYSTSSRVWFTISHGILNEIYFPTIDCPQTRDMQFLITDGETFFHEERRDLQDEIECMESNALGYRVTTSDPEDRYRVVKQIISDPHQPCVLIDAKLEGNPQFLKKLRVYVLLAPHLEVGGYGNSARRFKTVGQDVLIAWKGRRFLAMGANVGFSRTSCGYVGYSDGWQDLQKDFRLDWEFEKAEDGNVAVIGEINLNRNREFTIGIAFGGSLHAALTVVKQSLAIPFAEHREKFVEQWHRACARMKALDEVSGDGGELYRTSRNLLLAHEDKTFSGALIASASIPWGNAKGDEDVGGYHLVWTRDMVNSTLALLACADTVTPVRALVYLACCQRADGGFPQNFWIDGTPYWQGIQLDEVAFPILLAWHLWKKDALRDFDPYSMVRSAAAYLVRRGPVTQQERWEEDSGYSPSTLAVSIAALVCAADFADSRGKQDDASFLRDYADFLESHIEDWTVTTDGALLPEIKRHYIRIHPAAIDDLSPDENPNHGFLTIHNSPPPAPREFPAKDIVDPSFLELVRYGIRKPGDPLIEDSLRVVDAVLKVDTPFGPCWRRYNHDGYGTRPDGGPFEGWGQGRAWPLLTGERAHYEFAARRDVRALIRAIERFAFRDRMLPEQVWDSPDMKAAGMYFGKPAGSAMPLMWAHAEYIKLLRSVADGHVFDLIPIVAERYLKGRRRKDLEVWKPVRQVREVIGGQVLRIQVAEPFRLHWTDDGWASANDTPSTSTGIGIEFADIVIHRNQNAPVQFTFFWTRSNRWEEHNYEVSIQRKQTRAVAA